MPTIINSVFLRLHTICGIAYTGDLHHLGDILWSTTAEEHAMYAMKAKKHEAERRRHRLFLASPQC